MNAATTTRLRKLREQVERTAAREAELNADLGYPASYQAGSLVLTLRWDTLEWLLDLVESLRQQCEEDEA